MKKKRQSGAAKAAAARAQKSAPKTKSSAEGTKKSLGRKKKTNKTKDSDICHTCMEEEPPTDLDNADQEISWIMCDICRTWHHDVCVGRTGSDIFFECPLCFQENVM